MARKKKTSNKASKAKKSPGQAKKPAAQETTTPEARTDNRVPSGIIGLDEIIEGGFRDRTVTVVLGASGTGKSTLAMQYILNGLDRGEQGLYITLDVNPEQMIRESILWGWDRIQGYVDQQLFFFATKGSDFKTIIDEQLPRLVEARKEYDTPTRIVIDPLTPIIWAEEERSVQRELINKLFTLLKEIGCVVATVEEHTEQPTPAGRDASIPLFLSDGAIRLQYQPIGGAFNRTLEIVKMRGTRHGEEVYPYIFARGVGAVVRSTPVFHVEKARQHDEVFEQALDAARRGEGPEILLKTLEAMRDNWAYDYSPEEVLGKVLKEYGIAKRG